MWDETLNDPTRISNSMEFGILTEIRGTAGKDLQEN